MGALDTAVRQGKALYAGISSYSPERTRRGRRDPARARHAAADPPAVVLAAQPLDRARACSTCSARRASAASSFSPLAQGMLTDRYLDGIPDGLAREPRAARSRATCSPTQALAKIRALERDRRGPRPDARADGARLDAARPARDLDADRREQRRAARGQRRRARPPRLRRRRARARSTATRPTAASTSGPARATHERLDLHTPLCDLLGIRVPILLAGMANGPGTPELVAAGHARRRPRRVRGLGHDVRGARARHRARARARAGRAVRRQRAARAADAGDGRARAHPRGAARRSGASSACPTSRPSRRRADSPGRADRVPRSQPASTVITTFDDPAPVAEATRAAGAQLLPMVTTVDEARARRGVRGRRPDRPGRRGRRPPRHVRRRRARRAAAARIALVPQVVDAVGGRAR